MSKFIYSVGTILKVKGVLYQTITSKCACKDCAFKTVPQFYCYDENDSDYMYCRDKGKHPECLINFIKIDCLIK